MSKQTNEAEVDDEVDERDPYNLDPSPMTREEWICCDDTGASSTAIWRASGGLGLRQGRDSIPYDPSDFGRCYRLLKRVPECRSGLARLGAERPEWAPFVREWSRLEEMWEEAVRSGAEDAPEMYRVMRGLVDESHAIERRPRG